MSDTPESLLAEAKTAYLAGREGYRDALLRTGRLLHEFVLATLQQGDGLKERDRQHQKFARCAALEKAAGNLGITPGKVRALITVSMAASLIGEGKFGGLTHSTLAEFASFVRRRCGDSESRTGRVGGPPPSAAETWEIKPGMEEVARSLLARAIAGHWGKTRTHEEVLRAWPGSVFSRRGKTVTRTAGRQHAEGKAIADLRHLHKQASHASPGDVAEMCLDLIRAAEDPWAVAQRLLPELQRIRRPRASAAG